MSNDKHPNLLVPHDLTFHTTTPYVYHCHHYNLFHDQTIDDILGEEKGLELRVDSAHAAFRQLLHDACKEKGCRTPAERIELAQSLFAAMGQGRIVLDVSAEGGSARGTHVHYGFTWSEKYGSRVNRVDPADAVGAGFCAAATELAFDLPPGSMRATETACVAKRDPECVFEIRRDPHELPRTVGRSDYEALLSASEGGLHEERIASITSQLQQFLLGVSGDERGLVQAFGVFVTQHLSNYYNETAYAAVRAAERTMPSAVPMAEALLREAGHVCVFNTFGGILLSPEWEAVAGPLKNDPTEIVVGATAIARGLGFGRWSISELVPGERLVMDATSSYEAPHYRARFGPADKPRSYFLEGAALAMMVLAHRVDWDARPELTQAFYDNLFRGGGLGFQVHSTKCLARGDDRSRVVVERAS